MEFKYIDLNTGYGKIIGAANWLQFHDEDTLLQYSSNFIYFPTMPTKRAFIEAEAYQRKYHKEFGQQHVSFVFPENKPLSDELLAYLTFEKYLVSFDEMYAIDPQYFRGKAPEKQQVDVHILRANELEAFQAFMQPLDAKFGEAYTMMKRAVHKEHFEDEKIQQVVAMLDGQFVGKLLLHNHGAFCEIDDFDVAEQYQKQGIGAAMQKFVMKHVENKQVVLLADGNDTPRLMYQKQGYILQCFNYQCLKVTT